MGCGCAPILKRHAAQKWNDFLLETGLTQGGTLAGCSHSEADGSGFDESACDRQKAVTVSVIFDDRHKSFRLSQAGEITLQRSNIYMTPGWRKKCFVHGDRLFTG
jgi:hypothetical protein